MSIDHWMPMGTKRSYGRERLEVGQVIAMWRGAWTVVHVSDADATEDEEVYILNRRPEFRDGMKPYRLTLRRLHGPKHERENDVQELGIRLSPLRFLSIGVYEHGSVPLCSCCNHPWPCLLIDSAKAAEQAGERLNELTARAESGGCFACGEPITNRQGSVTYPEDNVRIIGYPPPVFHTRKACMGGRVSYERERAKIHPDAESLLEPNSPRMF